LTAVSSLRIGLLVSGVLHVAVVAAIAQSPREPIPAMQQQRPLAMKLAMFEPPVTEVRPQAAYRPAAAAPEPEPPPPAPEVPPKAADRPAAAAPEPPPKSVQPQKRPPEPVSVMKPEAPPPAVKKAVEPRPRPVRQRVVEPTAKRSRPADQVRPQRPPPVAIDPAVKQHYLAALAAQINRRKFYPRAARRLGEEGQVVVHFVIRRNGELTDLRVTESSGSPRLDEAALKTLRRVTPFRPIPEALDRDNWPISVPIAFSLRG
jgi:protein TonB